MWIQSLFLITIFFYSQTAHALSSSENAFRWENKSKGQVVIGADHAKLEMGEIYSSVIVLWGDFELYGEVDEITLMSGTLHIYPGAKIRKKLQVLGGEYIADPGSELLGDKIAFQTPSFFWRLIKNSSLLWKNYYEGTAKFIGAFSFIFLFWGLGILLMLFTPKWIKTAQKEFGLNWGKNLFVWLMGFIMIPVLGVMLVISIIGIFVLPLYFLFLFILGFISFFISSLWVGNRLWPTKENQKFQPWAYLLGIIVMQSLWWIHNPWGYALGLLLWGIGWGCTVRTLWQSK